MPNNFTPFAHGWNEPIFERERFEASLRMSDARRYARLAGSERCADCLMVKASCICKREGRA